MRSVHLAATTAHWLVRLYVAMTIFALFRIAGAWCAVRHRIFRDPLGRGEVAAEEVVDSVPGCGHDQPAAVHAGERRHIGSKRTQDLPALYHGHVVEVADDNLDWNDAQRFGESGPARTAGPGSP